MMGKNYSDLDLIKMQMDLLGNDSLVYGNNYHAKTKKEALEYMIKSLQGILEASENIEDDAPYGYRIHCEMFKKGEPRGF